MNQPAVIETDNTEIISNLVLNGDIKKMNQEQRVQYYGALCKSLGLNPLTQPFQIVNLSGKEVLYATKTATEQLRKINGISIDNITQKFERDMCITTVTGRDKTGRTDGATGVVNIYNLKGDSLANAIMKSETKAKRRFTLSISGLGMLDESEIETIPNAEVKQMTMETGEIPKEPQGKPAVPKKTAKEEAAEKLAALPDAVKGGFKALGYNAPEVYDFCNNRGWNHELISSDLNKIADKGAA